MNNLARTHKSDIHYHTTSRVRTREYRSDMNARTLPVDEIAFRISIATELGSSPRVLFE
jgi:hypothetical protein